MANEIVQRYEEREVAELTWDGASELIREEVSVRERTTMSELELTRY